MAEFPADEIRRAAALMRERATAASPGPWHQMCMGSEGCSVINDGRLRERKHVSFSGRKEWKADHADAEYIAGMDPIVALAVADWLSTFAGRGCNQDFAVPDWNGALAIARAYLGETEQGQANEEDCGCGLGAARCRAAEDGDLGG